VVANILQILVFKAGRKLTRHQQQQYIGIKTYKYDICCPQLLFVIHHRLSLTKGES